MNTTLTIPVTVSPLLPAERWNGQVAIELLEQSHLAVVARQLPPDHPAVRAASHLVVAAFRAHDLAGVRAANDAMLKVVAKLPRGKYSWEVKAPTKPSNPLTVSGVD